MATRVASRAASRTASRAAFRASRAASRLSRAGSCLFGVRSNSSGSDHHGDTSEEPSGKPSQCVNDHAPHLSLRKSVTSTTSYQSWYGIADEVAEAMDSPMTPDTQIGPIGTDIHFSPSGKILTGKYATTESSRLLARPGEQDGIIHFPKEIADEEHHGSEGTQVDMVESRQASSAEEDDWTTDGTPSPPADDGLDQWRDFDGGPYATESVDRSVEVWAADGVAKGEGRVGRLLRRAKSAPWLGRWRDLARRPSGRFGVECEGEDEAWWAAGIE